MKIMIVEDDPTIREMLGETVGKWGVKAVLCEDFQRVLNCFAEHQPHLILMDINLPVYDGFYWCHKIREVSKVPIIVLSSRDTPMDMVMAMNMGADDFIQKPFYNEVLIAKMKALLRRAYDYIDAAVNVIEHDGVILDLNKGTVVCGEHSADLTRNEFKILSLLMQHKGTIVSREKIMRSLWEDESFVDDNTLAVNMTRLRKKLYDLGRDGFITTIRGEGYVIK